MRSIGLGLIVLLSAAAFLSDLPVSAQQAPPVAIAPVPPAIYAAKKVFISNAGADRGLFPHPFSGDPDRGYNEF